MHPKDDDGMANSIDPDQTASSEAVWSWSALFAETYLSQYIEFVRYMNIIKTDTPGSDTPFLSIQSISSEPLNWYFHHTLGSVYFHISIVFLKLFNYQKADDKIFVCKFSKLYHIENSKTSGQTV